MCAVYVCSVCVQCMCAVYCMRGWGCEMCSFDGKTVFCIASLSLSQTALSLPSAPSVSPLCTCSLSLSPTLPFWGCCCACLERMLFPSSLLPHSFTRALPCVCVCVCVCSHSRLDSFLLTADKAHCTVGHHDWHGSFWVDMYYLETACMGHACHR